MPIVPAGSKVLVSGANGFIAVWVVQYLLEKGFSVRGTVRSAAKGEHLKKIFASYGDKFEVVIVEDITADGAFDEAVKGVDAIEHTASPFHLKADDPNEIIKPAVEGTLSILKSALKNGPNVKRIVVTSSVAAIVDSTVIKSKVFKEEDWNTYAPALVREKGREATNLAKYQASKTLAEQTAWDFQKEHKGSIGWDVVTINPPMVYGPLLHEVDNRESLNTSASTFFKNVAAGETPEETLLTGGGSWVDVRDVANAHLLSLTTEKAGGERFIASGGGYVWQDWLDVCNKVAPSIGLTKLQKGKPGAGKGAVIPGAYDATKSQTILGLRYHTMEETATAMLTEFKERGWLSHLE